MREIFIHIGSHKTGTTSIQHAFTQFPWKGASEDLEYLNIGPKGANIVKTRGQLDKFQARVKLRVAEKTFRPKGNSNFVASDEGLFWISEPDSVYGLAKLLHERYSRVTIICYLRRQDHLAVSHRKQVADGMPAERFYGSHATPLPKYQPHFQKYFNYADKLENIWVSAFGKLNVQVVSYDGLSHKKIDVVDDFTHRVGAILDASKKIHSNKSYKGTKKLAGLKLMEMGVTPRHRRNIIRAIPDWGRFLPSKEEAKTFLSNFHDSNQRLAEEWIWDDKPFAFDESFEMYPETTSRFWIHRKARSR